MLTLSPSVKIFAATSVVDGRKRADSLMTIVRDQWREEPMSGNWFIFFSRRFDRVRILYWDSNGFALWSKRIEKGRYTLPRSMELNAIIQQLDATELSLLLSGSQQTTIRKQAVVCPMDWNFSTIKAHATTSN